MFYSHFTNTSCHVTVSQLQLQDCPHRSSIFLSPVAINSDDALMIGCAAPVLSMIDSFSASYERGIPHVDILRPFYVTLCLLSFTGNVVGVAINHLNAFDGRHLLYTHNGAQWRHQRRGK